MAIKTTTGYAFPEVPDSFNLKEKTFLSEIRKLFDTLFSANQRQDKAIKKMPDTIYDTFCPVGTVILCKDSGGPPRWPAGSGTWEGFGTITTSDNRTFYVFERTA